MSASASVNCQQDVSLRLRSFSDALDGLPSVRAKLVRADGSKLEGQTDAIGNTAFIPVVTNEPLDIYLKQQVTPFGLALGQKESWVVPDPMAPPDSAIGWLLNLTQPILEPLLIDSSGDGTSANFHGRWILFPDPLAGGSYSFSANVGILLTPKAITAYAGYNNLTLPADYDLGLVIKTTDAEHLGATGLNLQLDCEGHGFSTDPYTDSFFIPSGPSASGSAAFSAAPVVWYQQRLVVNLAGELGNGYNIVLVRHNDGLGPLPGVTELEADPYDFGRPGLPINGGTTVVSEGTDCEPEPPSPPQGFGCSPSAASSNAACNAATLLSSGSGVITTKTTGTKCVGAPGGGVRLTSGTTWDASISVQFDFPGGNATPSGGYSHETSETLIQDMDAGANGCGSCAAAFMHHGTAWQLWNTEQQKLWIDLLLCFPSKSKQTCSVDFGPTSTTCSRTDC